VLSGREERALSGIEAMEAARDPAFASRFRTRTGSQAMSALRLLLGPVLCLVAIPLTLVLLIASPWLGIVGVAVFAAGIVLSLEPAIVVEGKKKSKINK